MTNTTNYSISVGVEVKNKTIADCKLFLKEKYHNKYDDLNPHINFLIMAMPLGKDLEIKKVIREYFSDIKKISFKLGELHFEDKSKFFSLPILNEQIMNIHKDLINLLNPFRGNVVRVRDLERINKKQTDKIEEDYIYKYGYLRVLDKFTPHITIGNLVDNFTVEDLPKIKAELDIKLNNLYLSELTFSKVYMNQIRDAEKQSDYKTIWEEDINLI